MLDIKYIRENQEEVIEKLKRRGYEGSDVELAVKHYEKYTNSLVQFENLKAKQKTFGKDDIEEAKKNKELMLEQEAQSILHKKDFESLLLTMPNIPAVDVPHGKDENDNEEIYTWGDEYKKIGDGFKHHFELTNEINFDQGAKLAKSRFAVIFGEVAKHERNLVQFMLENAISRNYIEVAVPEVTSSDSLLAAGQLPKFEQDLFKLSKREDLAVDKIEKGRDFYLIPTAEVQLANLFRGEIIKEELPIKYTAYTRCFRSEAGSAGRDTRGLIRMHEFGKVELFQYVDPEKSMEALEEMCLDSESVLKKLKLPYRKVLLCTGDMGFGAMKTYDLEVWFPGQQKYREVASISNVGDFQARRGKIRFKKDGQNIYPHMLNGSAMASGRILAALIENHQSVEFTIK